MSWLPRCSLAGSGPGRPRATDAELPAKLRLMAGAFSIFATGRGAARFVPRQTQYLLDGLALTAAFALAYLLRFEFQIPREEMKYAVTQLPYVVLIQMGALWISGVYRFVWRYVGMQEIGAFGVAAVLSAIPITVLRLTLPSQYHDWRVPLSVIIIDTGLGFGAAIAMRMTRRALWERGERLERVRMRSTREDRRALLVGAGAAGVVAAREISHRADLGLEICGFVDDDPGKIGSRIQGFRVLGSTSELARLVKDSAADEVIVTIARISRSELQRIVRLCEEVPVPVRIIPGLGEILQGRLEVSRLRKVEIEDLLGREQVKLEEDELRRFLSGKVVMVTGAGGSIGSELARQSARFEPAQLLLVERAEFVLFDIDRELRTAHPTMTITPIVADVGDEVPLRSIFRDYAPEIVIHAAAHKHVPLMESNPAEAVRNNVLATELLGTVAGESGAEALVLISTDKAVRPASIMGSSKRVAELVIRDLEQRYDTRFVVVRFGNVMGSTGSVIPIFREQIARGGPVTVTHPDMVRYFMTIPEASQLVLQAAAMGRGGEIFVLDMGEPVKIVDLAVEMIRLSGLVPGEDIEITFTGIRPGEKLFEQLGSEEEPVERTRHPKILIGDLRAFDAARLREGLARLRDLALRGEDEKVREVLRELVGAGVEARGVGAVGKAENDE